MDQIAAATLAACAFALCVPATADAWGDEGHEIVALIADHYLNPRARAEVTALLAGDTSGLTRDRTIAREATWADHYRDSDRDTTRARYNQTRAWHYVNIELTHADLDAACFGYPPLAAGTDASQGPADDCIVDKIDEFRGELANRATPPAERRLALQYLLHFIGDVHQPLHASDDHDHGGNDERVRGMRERGGSLHFYWDTVLVEHLGRSPERVASQLIAGIGPAQLHRWSAGDTSQWARESYLIAKTQVYGRLPPPDADGDYRLPESYADEALEIVRLQLQRAGVRLALVLNRAFPELPHTRNHVVNTIFPM